MPSYVLLMTGLCALEQFSKFAAPNSSPAVPDLTIKVTTVSSRYVLQSRENNATQAYRGLAQGGDHMYSAAGTEELQTCTLEKP